MLELIKKYEGLKLEAYQCSAGKWTIGYGSTFYADRTEVKEGDTITPMDAENMLIHYIKYVIEIDDLTLTRGQKVAVVSLIYSIGQTVFNKSKLKKAIKEDDKKAIFKEWEYIKVGDKVSKELCKRRAEEKLLFFS